MLKIILSSIFLVLVSFLAQTNAADGQFVLNCYYNVSSYKRSGEGRFVASDIDPYWCSNIYYGFFGIDDNGEVASLDVAFDKPFSSDGNIAQAISLKEKSSAVKILASIGNVNEGSEKFSKMVSSSENRTKFINSVLEFVEGNNFDGVDIHWEFPAESDRDNFASFLKELSAVLKPKNLLLTVAVAGNPDVARKSYDAASIAESVDYLNVISFGLSWAEDDKTGFYAPLQENSGRNYVNSYRYWIRTGVPAKQILMGIPFYGRTYTLADSAKNMIGDAASGPGPAGIFTGEDGLLSYNEICRLNWPIFVDYDTANGYTTNGDLWIGYDDRSGLGPKLNYLKAFKLGGGVIWTIDADDFRGECSSSQGESFRLLKYISKSTNLWFTK